MIYLDANATSALRVSAREAIQAALSEGIANPSSVHGAGRKARTLLSEARSQVESFLSGRTPGDLEVIFTSGGTESCNSLIAGLIGETPKHVVSSAIEHPAVLVPLERLEKAGVRVSRVTPMPDGVVGVNQILNALRDDTALVCVMAANNETGALQPITDIARALRATGYSGPIITDATQALGKSEVKVSDLFSAGVSALALSGHKLGALPGIGAMVFPSDTSSLCFPFEPLLHGGSQENRFRAGSENLIGAVSLGAAASELRIVGAEERKRLSALREQLWDTISLGVPFARRLTPAPEMALSNTLLVHTPGLRGDDLVVGMDLRGVCISTGSACASGKQQPSHVVKALGIAGADARDVVRFSLDWDTTREAVEFAAVSFTSLCAISTNYAEARA